MAFTKCWLAYPAIPGAACEKLTVCVPAGDDPVLASARAELAPGCKGRYGAALAAALPFTAGPRYAIFALGAAAFAVSDVFVAKDALSGATDRQRNGALLLYYLAVYAMAFVQL